MKIAMDERDFHVFWERQKGYSFNVVIINNIYCFLLSSMKNSRTECISEVILLISKLIL